MFRIIPTILFLSVMTTTSAAATGFQAKELPYAYQALEPQLSEETLRYHHDKHYKGYVAKLNELIVDTPFARRPLEEIIAMSEGPLFNNAAQVWNHEFYFEALSPTPKNRPEGELARAIDRDFGSFDRFREQMDKACAALFGSGWVWLVEDKTGKLSIMSEQNAGNPLRYGMKPLLAIDVWEHAYYIDYRNRRADSVAALWERIDWRTVEKRYEK